MRVPLLVGAGATLAESGFIAQLVEMTRTGRPQEVDDVLIRFPTWTRDVADAIAFLLGRNETGRFLLSAARGATRYGWTREVAEILGSSPDPFIPSRHVAPRPAARPRNSQLADTRIRALGFRLSTDFRAVIQSVMSDQ